MSEENMEHAEQKDSGGGILKFLGIGCLVLLILLIVGVVIVVKNIKKITTSVARKAAVEMIQNSDLPKNQQDKFIKQIDRVADAYKTGEISNKQLSRILEKIGDKVAKGPVINMALVSVAKAKYIEPSGLDDDEKAEGKIHLERVGKGISDDSIPPKDIEKLLSMITEQKGEEKKLKESLSDEEVRALIDEADEIADKADIPKQHYNIDPADEISQTIDEVLEEENVE